MVQGKNNNQCNSYGSNCHKKLPLHWNIEQWLKQLYKKRIVYDQDIFYQQLYIFGKNAMDLKKCNIYYSMDMNSLQAYLSTRTHRRTSVVKHNRIIERREKGGSYLLHLLKSALLQIPSIYSSCNDTTCINLAAYRLQ